MTPFYFAATETATPGRRRIEVPVRTESKRELLDLLAKAFPLPAYFGHNWDALEECLLNLEWMPDREIGLVHHDVPLGATPSDQRLYLRILAEAAKASSRLHITFPAESHAEIERLLVG